MLEVGLIQLAAAVCLLTSARAQTVLLTLDTPNPQPGAIFGLPVATGDVNADGKGDIAAGAFLEDVGRNEDQGRAYVFSGADGSLLFTLDAPKPQAALLFGRSLAVGEVSGDAMGDIAVGASGDGGVQGRAYVFSGADGSLLLTLDTPNPQVDAHYGLSVAMGDVNGDSTADITVGAPDEEVGGNPYQGRAYVFSGADGSLLFTLNTPNPQPLTRFGWSLAVGEVNGDGKGDIAVGAFFEDVGGNNTQGRAYVFSGADGSLLFTLNTPNPQAGARFGMSVTMGDVNTDGRADIAVGAPWEDVPGDVPGSENQGRAYVFSGTDGSLLFTLNTPNPQAGTRFGEWVAAGELSGDAKQDIAVAAAFEDVVGNADQGRAYVFSGADGSLLFTLDTPNPQAGALFGYSVAVGQVDGYGRADIVLGAQHSTVAGNAQQGRAYVFSFLPTAKVGGAAQDLPDLTGAPLQAPGSSGTNPGALAGLIAGVTAGALAVGGAAWYGRRRWLR
jgi:hypothetical protein